MLTLSGVLALYISPNVFATMQQRVGHILKKIEKNLIFLRFSRPISGSFFCSILSRFFRVVSDAGLEGTRPPRKLISFQRVVAPHIYEA